MCKIYFVLPGYSRVPAGGYKIVFEYANHLANDGYKVNIIYLDYNRFPRFSWKWLILDILIHFSPKWFKLNKSIKQISIKSKKKRITTSSTDIVIATAVETAEPVKEIFPKGKKFYFIQDQEDWRVSKNYLIKTYNLGFTNITISKWLKKFVDNNSHTKSVYIQNPINTKIYKVNNKIDERNKYYLGMLYHKSSIKGCKYALKAIALVHKKYPKTKLIMFGTFPPPRNLPKWIIYYRNASQNQTVKIYNSVSIFVSASVNEGFGLTGLEAMACGAVLVSTNYLGVREYAKNGKNALLSPVKDTKALEKNIEYLINNKNIRERLAYEGVKSAKFFSEEKAYKKFKNIIMS